MCRSENWWSSIERTMSCTHDDTPPATYGYVPSRKRQTSGGATASALASDTGDLALREEIEAARSVGGFGVQLHDARIGRHGDHRLEDAERDARLKGHEL